MFETGEYVVHPGQGTCRVEGFTEGEMPSYRLMPVGQRNAIHILYPQAFEERLRPVVAREDAERAIASYPSIEPDSYTERSAALEEPHFRDLVKTGSCEDVLCVVKTLRGRIATIKAGRKKPPAAYERLLKMAEERSLGELSVALGIPCEEVVDRFRAVDPTFEPLQD